MKLQLNKKFSNRIHLIALVCLLLIPRIGLACVGFTRPDAAILTDSAGYLTLAENLQTTGRFQAWEYEEKLRTPVYPAFLAAIRALFGDSVGFIVLIQLMVSLATAWLIWRQAMELFGPKAGLASLWLYALNPNALFWAATVMTETLFAFWLVLTSYLTIRGLRDKSNRILAASGLALSLAVLTRPIGLFLVPLWLLGIFIYQWHGHGIRQAVKPAAVFLFMAAVPILGWQTRNAVVHGRFFLSSSGPTAFSNFIVGYVLEDELGIPREEAVVLISEAEDPMAYSIEVIRQYPMTAIRVTGRGLIRTFLGTEVGLWLPLAFDLPYEGSGLLSAIFSGDWEGVTEALQFRMNAAGDLLGTLLLVWGIGYSIVLYALIARGLDKLRKHESYRAKWMWLLIAASSAYLLCAPLSIGDARFRLPAEPWLAILGGLAFGVSLERSNVKPEHPA